MTRLELLKKELSIVKELKCIPLDIKHKVISRYNIEIEAIEKYKLLNPEVKGDNNESKF